MSDKYELFKKWWGSALEDNSEHYNREWTKTLTLVSNKNRKWNKDVTKLMNKEPIQLENHEKTKERKLSTLEELNKMMEGNEQKLMDAMMSKFYDLPPVKCKAMMQGHVHMLSKFDIEKVKRKIKEVVDYKEIIL